jgi:hypothetical protein
MVVKLIFSKVYTTMNTTKSRGTLAQVAISSKATVLIIPELPLEMLSLKLTVMGHLVEIRDVVSQNGVELHMVPTSTPREVAFLL